MNHHFPEPLNSASNPLDRLVEAFVELSVPEGPDAATQRRLIAALTSASSPVANPVSRRPDEPPTSRVRRWSGAAARQTLALAASIAAVGAGAVYLSSGRDDGPTTVQGRGEQQVVVAPVDDGSPAEPLPTPAAQEKFVRRLVDVYLRSPDGKRPSREALNAFVAKVIEDNPDIAKSRSWQFAQEKLSSALDQPEVIGLGVGLLGTLPWTTYGRF